MNNTPPDNDINNQQPPPENPLPDEQLSLPSLKPSLENGNPQLIITSPPITSQERLLPNGAPPSPDYTLKKPWESIQTSSSSKGTELFLGNLHIDTTDDDIYSLFKSFGPITDLRIHKNKDTKKCYAFIRFQTKSQASSAMTLNGTYLNGRLLKVTKSNENSTIFIGNIRKTWTQHEVEVKIKRIFNNAIKIEYFKDPCKPNKNRGFCFAIFRNRNEAIKALNYVSNKGGIVIDGISLTCDWADVVDEDDSNSKQVFISGINVNINEEKLKQYLMKYGNVENIVLSRNHIHSKRKDLVFVSYETHLEAYQAVTGLNAEKEKEENEEMMDAFEIKGRDELNLIQVSLAFSQQAMQNKKKMKDGRKRINSISAKLKGKESIIDTNGICGNGTFLQSQLLNPLFDNNVNATAMLAMVNLLNMNKNNPVILNQMVSAGLGAMANSAMNINQIIPPTPLPKAYTTNTSSPKQFLNKKHKPSSPIQQHSPNIN